MDHGSLDPLSPKQRSQFRKMADHPEGVGEQLVDVGRNFHLQEAPHRLVVDTEDVGGRAGGARARAGRSPVQWQACLPLVTSPVTDSTRSAGTDA